MGSFFDVFYHKLRGHLDSVRCDTDLFLPLSSECGFVLLRFLPQVQRSFGYSWLSHRSFWSYPANLASFSCVFSKRFRGYFDTVIFVSVVSLSHDGDVVVYVRHKPTELAHSFLFCSCVCFYLCGPFNCILFHKFSRQFF